MSNVIPLDRNSVESLGQNHGGESDQSRRVRVSESGIGRHRYIFGGTGTGKSTLLLNTITQDTKRGEAVCLIDPHNDLLSHLLQMIPKPRVMDVVVLDLENPGTEMTD